MKRYDSYRQGREELSSGEILSRYGETISRMDVEAHLIALGYRPNEKWMFQLSVPFLRVSADANSAGGSKTSMLSEGISDLELNLTRYFNPDPQSEIAINLGIGMPTGSIDERLAGGGFLPYNMQLGSETWDLSPGIAFIREAGKFEFGISAEAEIHLGENSRDYSLGDSVQGTVWLDYIHSPYVEFGAFVRGGHMGKVDGPVLQNGVLHWNPENYGGSYLEGGLAVRLLHPSCPYGGKFLEFRASTPIWEETNGVHLVSDWTLDIGFGISF